MKTIDLNVPTASADAPTAGRPLHRTGFMCISTVQGHGYLQLRVVGRLGRSALKQMFSSALLTLGIGSLLWGAIPQCKKLSGIPGFCPVEARNPPSVVLTIKNVFQQGQVPPGVGWRERSHPSFPLKHKCLSVSAGRGRTSSPGHTHASLVELRSWRPPPQHPSPTWERTLLSKHPTSIDSALPFEVSVR